MPPNWSHASPANIPILFQLIAKNISNERGRDRLKAARCDQEKLSYQSKEYAYKVMTIARSHQCSTVIIDHKSCHDKKIDFIKDKVHIYHFIYIK